MRIVDRLHDPLTPYARPFTLRGPLETTVAERYDMLLYPRRRGTSIVTFEYLHWISGRVLGVAHTTITGR